MLYDHLLFSFGFIPPLIWWGILGSYFRRTWWKVLRNVSPSAQIRNAHLITTINNIVDRENKISLLVAFITLSIPLSCIPLFWNHPTITHFVSVGCFVLNCGMLASHLFTFFRLLIKRFFYVLNSENR